MTGDLKFDEYLRAHETGHYMLYLCLAYQQAHHLLFFKLYTYEIL